MTYTTPHTHKRLGDTFEALEQNLHGHLQKLRWIIAMAFGNLIVEVPGEVNVSTCVEPIHHPTWVPQCLGIIWGWA